MSVKVTAQLNPVKKELINLSVSPKPISEILYDLNSGFPLSQARVCRNGEIVTDFSLCANDGDELAVKFIPCGTPQQAGAAMKGGGWSLAWLGLIINFAFGWTGIGALIGTALIGTGLSMALGGTVLLNINIPTPEDREKPESDPSIRGGKNQMRSHGRVPVLFGRHRVYPDLAANPHTQIIGNQQYFTQLFCGGYKDCVIDLDSLKLGETSVTDLSQTKNKDKILSGADPVIWIEILQDGEASKIYPYCIHEDAFNSPLKNLVEDGSGNKISGAIERSTPDKTDRINVDIFFHNGIGKYDDDGKLTQASVTVNALYKPEGAPDSSYQLLGNFTESSNTISGAELKTKRYQITKSGLPPGQYTVKIVRVTEDSTDSKIIDEVYAGTIRSYKSVRPIREERQKDLTVIAMRVMATAKLNGVIDSFNYIASSKLFIHSKEGTGPLYWLNAEQTRNPASMLMYALQGRPAQQVVDPDDIDWPSVEAFYAWCEEHDYTCNAYLSEAVTIAELIRMIGNTSRAEILRIDSKISVVQDIERPSHLQLFTPKNTISYSVTMFKADVPDAISLRYIDEKAGFAQNELQVYNTPDGNRVKEPETIQKVDLFGITDDKQARRIGMYNYACLKNRPFVHTIEADIEYLLVNKGDWIQYAGDIALTGSVQGRIAGLLYENNLCAGVRLDEPVEYEAGKQYAVRIRLSKGTVLLKEISHVNEQYDVYFSQALENEDEFPEIDNIYAFGIRGYEVIDLIITDIQPQEDLRASLTCVEYSPEIFNIDKDDFILPEFVNRITPVSGAVDTGTIGLDVLQTWLTYHDDVQEPQKPSGDGTENGWHRLITPQSNWVSRKTARFITEGEWRAPEKTSFKVINEAASSRPTFNEIVNGFTAEGAVMVPVQLELTAQGGFRSVSLSWMKQVNLSNLKNYELQVSDNAVNWYALRFDGLGPADAPWRGEENKVFSTAASFVVHANIPPAGSADEPAGRILYYRVRQRTMLDVVSQWSEISGAQTKLTDTGDYAANSISANAIITAELLGIFAKLTESLVVDPRYGVSSENAQWADGDTRAVLNARQIAFQFFSEAVWLTMARLGLEGVEATQVYSQDKLYITNADMLSRRKRGFDVGSPFPSDYSRIAHLDVQEELLILSDNAYVLDQNNDRFFQLSGTGSLEGDAEGVPLFIKAIAPYATEARALHGNFCLFNTFNVNGQWTFDFWIFYFWNENQILFSIGNESEKLQFIIANEEPYLNDEPTEGVWLNDEPTEGAWFNEIRSAHVLIRHAFMGNITETELNQNELEPGKWYHFGVIADSATLKLLINNKNFFWQSRIQTYPITIDINSTAGTIDGENSLLMIDEIMFDPSVALDVEIFNRNTALRRPWGKLDDQHPWMILNVQNPQFFKTNIFESPAFKESVQAVINGG